MNRSPAVRYPAGDWREGPYLPGLSSAGWPVRRSLLPRAIGVATTSIIAPTRTGHGGAGPWRCRISVAADGPWASHGAWECESSNHSCVAVTGDAKAKDRGRWLMEMPGIAVFARRPVSSLDTRECEFSGHRACIARTGDASAKGRDCWPTKMPGRRPLARGFVSEPWYLGCEFSGHPARVARTGDASAKGRDCWPTKMPGVALSPEGPQADDGTWECESTGYRCMHRQARQRTALAAGRHAVSAPAGVLLMAGSGATPVSGIAAGTARRVMPAYRLKDESSTRRGRLFLRRASADACTYGTAQRAP